MKFVKTVCAILALIICAACADTTPRAERKEYPLSTVVTDVNMEQNIVVVEDFNGNLWEFCGCEDWFEGDICALIMDNMGTEFVEDDEIVSIKYCGFIEKN